MKDKYEDFGHTRSRWVSVAFVDKATANALHPRFSIRLYPRLSEMMVMLYWRADAMGMIALESCKRYK